MPMTTFINRTRGSGQTRPEGGAHAALGPARPVVLGIGIGIFIAVSGLRTTVATSTIGSSSQDN